jgi:membrane-bound inhibitor of C-type lysozyme
VDKARFWKEHAGRSASGNHYENNPVADSFEKVPQSQGNSASGAKTMRRFYIFFVTVS